MGQIKTAELEGTALDWAVAKCEGAPYDERSIPLDPDGSGFVFAPSIDWAQGGPIIEREHIGVWEQLVGNKVRWASEIDDDNFAYGHTPLIAAMRCYVASKLGDAVEVPDEVPV